MNVKSAKVGLFVDPCNTELRQYCANALSGRVTRLEKMVVNLKALGFEITAEECLKVSGLSYWHAVHNMSKAENQ